MPRLLSIAGAALVLAALAAYLVVDDGSSTELPSYWSAPDFALVDQTSDTLRSGELRGAPWIASFVFTSCRDVCPMITSRMARLRDRLEDEGLLGDRVRLVSFTVDPARDSPAVLREYAGRFGGSPPSEWAFLTGERPDRIRAMIQEGFRLAATGPEREEGDYQVSHSPRVLLVDGQGTIRGIYDGTEEGMVDAAAEDAMSLVP